MCTAVVYRGEGCWFGRNLDLERTWGEEIVFTPRNFPVPLRAVPTLERHYAMLGMARMEEGVPLYFDAVNEAGLAMAGLNFPGYAAYAPYRAGADNVTPFELIPWVLGRCADVEQAREALKGLNLLDWSFSPDLPLTPLHFLLADRTGAALVAEPGAEGLRLYDAPVGVLTNAPPFDWQMTNLSRYMALRETEPENVLIPEVELPVFSRGMGGIGLPGDLSSPSRFVRAAFTARKAAPGKNREESMAQVFRILNAVAQTRGCVRLPEGGEEETIYSACCDLERGSYCYTTRENSRITRVEMGREDPDGTAPVTFPLRRKQDIFQEN